MVRHTATFTSVSWLPSEAMPPVLMRIPMVLGISHYDPPLPDRVADRDALEQLHAEGRFRFANRLEAFIEVDDDGTIVAAGQTGSGRMGTTVADLKMGSIAVPAVGYPDLRPEAEHGDGWVRFTQTAGGRTAWPMPRKIDRPPFVRFVAPPVWTTLSLTLHADGRSEYAVTGASPFPRHWFYDDRGDLVAKSGLADYREWAADMDTDNSPWGDREHEPTIAEAETALERSLSAAIMQQGQRPEVRTLDDGGVLTEQGQAGTELYLVLDGMLSVEVDGSPVAEVGPGAILGERAILEGGRRTSTLRAITPVKVAVAAEGQVDREALETLAGTHRREDETDQDSAGEAN